MTEKLFTGTLSSKPNQAKDRFSHDAAHISNSFLYFIQALFINNDPICVDNQHVVCFPLDTDYATTGSQYKVQ